jgi:hypothetical protein
MGVFPVFIGVVSHSFVHCVHHLIFVSVEDYLKGYL